MYCLWSGRAAVAYQGVQDIGSGGSVSGTDVLLDPITSQGEVRQGCSAARLAATLQLFLGV